MGARTIPEIARELGLSNTTVADALRGTGRVSAATRDRVQAFATASGYRVNRSARQLRTGTADSVGLYIGSDVRNMPFYMPFTFGVMEELAERGFDTTLISHAPNLGAGSEVGALLIIDALPDDPVLHELLNTGVPTASAGRLATGSNAIPAISVDYPATIRSALKRLAAAGGHRPALIAPEPRDPLAWSELIAATYNEVCGETGIQALTVRVPTYATNEHLQSGLEEILASGYHDSIFFSWQGIADRAHALLLRQGEASSSMRTATLIDTRVDGASYPYDVLVDLDARRFGAAAADLAVRVMTSPQRLIPSKVHPAVVLAGPI